MLKKMKAFSLAEVLIALTIISIVGALTISTVSTNYKKSSYVAGLKEADQLISNAASLMVKENGGNLAGLFSSSNSTMQEFANKLQAQKTCLTGFNTGCWHKTIADYTKLSGNTGSINPDERASLILRNGMLLFFDHKDQTCTNTIYLIDGVGNGCAEITVDVNGLEKPNKFGRDIYVIGVGKYGTYLNGQDGTTVNDCTTSDNGTGCAAKVINEGGMKY